MKLNKKLLVFALSVLMLVGILAVAAFAAGEADVLTIKYMDGTVQTYAVGETVAPPAIPTDFAYVDEDGKAYKYTVSGTAWEGIPATVTAADLGKTINATVAGTKGDAQVYYVTWEKLTADAEFRVVYHLENNVHQYLSSSNKGDKGDGTNTGAYSAQELGSSGSAGLIRIKLYWDVDVSSFAMNIMPSPRKSQGVNTYFDLNGHTVKSSQTSGFIDGKAVHIRIYSSVPGAHFYLTGASAMFRANDDCGFYLGSESSDVNYPDKGNISFHGQAIFGQQYGSGGQIWGGKYYQTAQGSVGFLELSRRVSVVSCAEFYTVAGSSPLTDTAGHNSASIATGSTAIQNCVFYSPAAAPVITSTQSTSLVFDNCTFVNVYADAQVSATVKNIVRNGCASNISNGGVYTASAASYVFARVAPYAVTGLVAADGSAIEATVNYLITDPANALKLNYTGGSEYWTVGETFDPSAGDSIKLEGTKLWTTPEFDVAGVAEIVDGKIAAAGEVTVSIVYTKEDVVAFTYKDTKTGKLYAIGYALDCGSTAEGVFAKFYELFNAPASSYVITMYQDMTVNKAMGFGALVETADSYNRDYYNTAANGNIVWDLNGTTVTVSADTTGYINPAAANHAVSNPSGWNSGNPKTVFCFEGESATKSFTLKSSKAGGKLVNESAGALFAVGEGKRTPVIFEGEGLTIVSDKNWIFYGIELQRDIVANATPRLTVNGGTYISAFASGLMRFCGNTAVSNATFISTNASAAQLLTQGSYRVGTATLDNVTFIAENATALAYYSNSSNSHSASFNDCVYIGCEPTTLARCSEMTSLTYTGINLASAEDALALIYASAPEGTAKYTFKAVINGEKIDLFGYAPADKVYTVTYAGANVTETYLVGKVFAPIAMDSAYYTVAVRLAEGLVNLPVAWADVPAAGALAASFGGQTVTVSPAENWLAAAFILVDVDDNVLAYTLADSETVGADLATAVAAQASNAYLFIYQDITAPALTFNTTFVINANDNVITLADTFTANGNVSVVNAKIVSGLEKPFAVTENGAITLVKTNAYLSGASAVATGEGGIYLHHAAVYVLGDAIPLVAGGATAGLVGTVKLANVVLDSNVLVYSSEATTVLGTAGTFAGCTYEEGVISGLIVNNNAETITVLGQSYTVAYAEAVTTDASKAIEVTYMFDGVVRGTQMYYYGSIANFYSELTGGYYFEYVGTNALAKNETYECSFHADASKLKAQVSLKAALNYTFYLQVEDEGVLANLKLNGVAIDFADLDQIEIEGKLFYVIPVSFATFADALNDYVLSVDLVGADSSLNITANAALDDYLAEVLATASESEAQLAYAVVEYIEALFIYFDYDLAFSDVRLKNFAKLGNLLADYAEYKIDLPAFPEVPVVSSDYVHGALLVADEQITFAFRIEEGFAGKVEINGNVVPLSKPFEGFDRTYAMVSVDFEDLKDDVTIVITDGYGNAIETVTYTLANYIAGVSVQNEGVVADYAKALWKLAAVASVD